MRSRPFSIAGSLDDYLVSGVGHPVQGAVGYDDEAGDPRMADYELVQVSRLLGCEAMEAEVIEDEQVRGEERA